MISDSIGYIITETFMESEANVVSEHNGRLIAEGILQTADERNRNGRFYPKEELFPQLEAPRTLELLNAGYLRAELGHPLDKELIRQQTIDDKLTCAQFLKLWTNGNDIWATFRGTNNAYGETFDKDLRDGCKPAWSLRALGSVRNTSRGAEVHNLKIITWDQVIYPSHPGAYTQRVLGESAGIEIANGVRIAKGNTDKASVIAITNESVINYIKSESCNLKYMKENFDFMYNKITVSESGSTVTLTANDGNIFVVNLETCVHNEIMNYCESIVNMGKF
nr:MAG TPA: Prohead core protein serine protease [Caudoviricetes sp.]